MSSAALSQQSITGVYLPSALLLVGVAVVKPAYLPYAAVCAALYGGYAILTGQSSIKIAAKEPFLKPDAFQHLKVANIKKTSHNVKIYRFALPKEDMILGLPIGQHISLAATPKNNNPDNKEIVRSYTPISSDEDLGYVEFMIKSYPQGNISAHMDTLEVGDTMKLRGPKGAMVYSPNMVKRIGMIAGGTGITPMLQIIAAIKRGRPTDKTQVDLIFANVNPDDILLKDMIDELAESDPNFKVYYVLNNPPDAWTGGVGFVTADMIKEKLAPPGPDMKLLMCGPPLMISALKKATESLGYTKARPVSKLEDQVFCF